MASTELSRRSFVKLSAFTAAAAAMAGTAGANLVEVEPAAAADAATETQRIRTMCRACLNNCGMVAHVRDGKVIKLEGDPDDPMNKGAACAKGLAGIQALYNPCRIKYPMKRIGERGSNQWERMSWNDALDEIADIMMEWYEKEGPKSLVCSTGGGGNPQFFSPARFLSVWGGGNFFEPGCAQCYLPRNHMESVMNGTADTSLADGPVTEPYLPDCKTKCYVMWAVGPSTHGIGSTGRIVTELRNSGTKTVVIDPRFTPDAARADVWLPIRPGTDVALMLCWINYIIEHELFNADFCEKWTNLPFLVDEKTGLTIRADELGLGKHDEYVVYNTKSGKVEVMPYPKSNNYHPLPYYIEPKESPVEGDPGYDPAYPYTLTQGRLPIFHHGTLRNVPFTRELWPYPETWINPETAAEIGIEDGDWLWLESRRGKTQGRARVTKSVAPKVIYQERFWNPELLDSSDPNRSWQVMNVNILTQNCDEYAFNDVYSTYVLRGVQINITKADGAPEGIWTEPEDFKPWLPEESENTGGGNAVYGA